MNEKYLIKLTEKYENLSNLIEWAWSKIVGWGCGYFDHWILLNHKTIRVFYYRPRNGGLASDDFSVDEILKIINKD